MPVSVKISMPPVRRAASEVLAESSILVFRRTLYVKRNAVESDPRYLLAANSLWSLKNPPHIQRRPVILGVIGKCHPDGRASFLKSSLCASSRSAKR